MAGLGLTEIKEERAWPTDSRIQGEAVAAKAGDEKGNIRECCD